MRLETPNMRDFVLAPRNRARVTIGAMGLRSRASAHRAFPSLLCCSPVARRSTTRLAAAARPAADSIRRNRPGELVRASLSWPARRQWRDLRHGEPHRRSSHPSVRNPRARHQSWRTRKRWTFGLSTAVPSSTDASSTFRTPRRKPSISIGPGVAQVRLDILSAPELPPADNWFAVQAGAFPDKSRAERLRASLEREYGPARLVMRAGTSLALARSGGKRTNRRRREGSGQQDTPRGW